MPPLSVGGPISEWGEVGILGDQTGVYSVMNNTEAQSCVDLYTEHP